MPVNKDESGTLVDGYRRSGAKEAGVFRKLRNSLKQPGSGEPLRSY